MSKNEFEDCMEIGDKAIVAVLHFLNNKTETNNIIDVQNVLKYREMDVDLIWQYTNGENNYNKLIEVKGDTNDYTGNVFLEITSNTTKKTPGWIHYTKADFIFYYFINTGMLYCFPTIKLREWFYENQHRYKVRPGETKKEGNIIYRSEGRIVSIKHLLAEIPSVKVKNIKVKKAS